MSKLKMDRNQLAEQFGIKISGLAHRMIQNNDLAREAAQEVWYEILNSLASYRGDSDISTWMYTIAKRTILKYARAERIYTTSELNNHFDLGPIEYNGLEESKEQWVREKCDYCLTAFCHCLNNESRLIFLFHDIVELKYSQISEIMEMKESNLRQIVSRSKEKVRNFMDRNCALFNPNADCKCRIRKHVISVDLDKTYNKLAQAANLVDVFQKIDKQLPRKNYWEKFVSEVVTS